MFLYTRLCRTGSVIALCTIALASSGCAGGGSLPPAATRPAPAPLGSPYNPSGNAEFTRNDGVNAINAEAAYLRGATGAGVTVAVVDTGVDIDHPDLVGNIAADSFDVVSGTADVVDASGHGTKVAGVIAAERNGLGTHGVAYDATLLAVRAYRCNGSSCSFLLSDLANAVNYATDHMAHVINMSVGGDVAPYADLNAAIGRATSAGAFVVVAAGNEGASEPLYPANIAGNPSLGGMVVAVAAANDSGSIASFSNDCGAAMNSCLVAPGVLVATTMNGATSATQTTSASGTSFAAPHVSGALALLIQLYPDAYAADPRSISMFMFDGARDMGAAGVDAVYGHGMLDVAGAIDTADAAIAAAAVPLSGGTYASLSGTSLTSSPAFGSSLSGLSALNDAIAVIRLSDGDHAYRARLGDSIAPTPRRLGLESLMAGPDMRILGRPLGDRGSLAVALADDAAPADGPVPTDGGMQHTRPRGLQLTGSLDAETDVRLGIDVAAPAQLRGGPLSGRAGVAFLAADETMSPVALLAGRGNALSLERSLDRATTLALALFEGESGDLLSDAAGGSATSLGVASLSHDFAAGGALRLDLGLLDEDAAQLGGQGSGALATAAGASTRYVTVGGAYPVGRGIDLLGSVTLAATEMGDSAGSVFTNWDTVRSNAFGIGAAASDVLGAGDRLGLLVGQPLRAYEANATVAVPVALDGDGQVVSRSERAKLTPTGREIDLQLGYGRTLASGMDLSSWLMFQFEPGHDAGADTGVAAGVTFNLAF